MKLMFDKNSTVDYCTSAKFHVVHQQLSAKCAQGIILWLMTTNELLDRWKPVRPQR